MLRWQLEGFTWREAAEWAFAGLGLAAAVTWKKFGFGAYEAGVFLTIGIEDPDIADIWCHALGDVTEVAAYIGRGFDIVEAEQWAGSDGWGAEGSAAWRDAGYSIEEAMERRWRGDPPPTNQSPGP